MRKYYLFIFVILMVVFCYIFMINNSKSYIVHYNIKDFKVLEKYNKKEKYYSFLIKYKEQEFKFVSEKEYSNKRKLIKNIDFINNDAYYCLKPIIKGFEFEYLCFSDKYTDQYISGLITLEKAKKIKTIDNIDIFNKDNDYFLWNGYGITELLSGKKYNFLKKEHYDNTLSITTDNYILFVNYDQTHTFDKLFIFDSNKKKIIEWDIKYEIDFDSYFMGYIDNYIYLFDRKNMVQYKINIDEKKIDISSDNNGALYFDKEWSTKSLNELKYKDYFMDSNYIYKYFTKNNKLYLNIDNNNDILISNNKIKDIIYKDNNKVYYLVGETLYSYTLKYGEQPLLKDFEWNFSYKNKIFIF